MEIFQPPPVWISCLDGKVNPLFKRKDKIGESWNFTGQAAKNIEPVAM